MSEAEMYRQRLYRLPFHFMGADCEFYEQSRENKDVFCQMTDYEGSVVRTITRKEAFELYEWPRGFVFRVIITMKSTKDGKEITNVRRMDNIITDIDLNILSGGDLLVPGGEGNLREQMKIDVARYGKENVSYKQLSEIKIYRRI